MLGGSTHSLAHNLLCFFDLCFKCVFHHFFGISYIFESEIVDADPVSAGSRSLETDFQLVADQNKLERVVLACANRQGVGVGEDLSASLRGIGSVFLNILGSHLQPVLSWRHVAESLTDKRITNGIAPRHPFLGIVSGLLDAEDVVGLQSHLLLGPPREISSLETRVDDEGGEIKWMFS